MNLILHGPPLGPTGIGYARGYLAEALHALGHVVTCWTPQESLQGPGGRILPVIDPSWRQEGVHVCIDQPMTFDPASPWSAFMPFFELPPRADERPKLQVVGKRKILCCHEDIQRWALECNSYRPDISSELHFPLVQLGADPLEGQPPERKPGSLVTVGKAEPRKGTRILLKALKALGITGAYLAITHPLHQQVELERLQEHADDGGHVLIPFSPSHEDVQRLLAASHVAVFASCAEGWNLGLTEALAQGCVVVVSDIAAHRRHRDLLIQELAEEEVNARMVLVPTKRVSMTHHQRWYPALAYPNVKWDECSAEDLALGIQKARSMPIPPPWQGRFPMTWRRAAERLVEILGVERRER